MKQKMLRFFFISLAFIGLSGKIMADTAQEIANYINSITYGDLTAVVSGNTVTVSSTPGVTATPNNADFLKFSIDGGVTVIWKATLNGTPSSNFSLINISGGSGLFEMQSGNITNSGTGRAITNNSASEVRISGGTVSTSKGTTIYNASSGELNILGNSTVSSGTIAIENVSTGKVRISGGIVITTNDGSMFCTNAIDNTSSGTIEVSGGTVSAVCGSAIRNSNTYTSGTVNVSGGTVMTTSEQEGTKAIYSCGIVNISGGTVSAIKGNAICITRGTANISDNAYITSANTSSWPYSNGTIYLDISSNGILNINGGTIENTASGNAIYSNALADGTVNVSAGTITAGGNTIDVEGNKAAVNISGGTISTYGSSKAAVYVWWSKVNITGGTVSTTQSNSYAIYLDNYAKISLGGNPTITGRIYTYSQGLSVLTDGIDLFAPGSKIYTLDFPSELYSSSTIAVMDGRNFLANFALYNPAWKLLPSGAHLAMEPSGVDIKETNNDLSLQIYPNPTSGQLTIESGEVKIGNVEIYDVIGKKIITHQMFQMSPEIVIDISHLQAGFYFLRITTEAGEVIKKVLKE